jgi:hypothetical protein
MTDIGHSRRQWRRAFYIVLGAFVLALAGLVYATTDRNVTYADQRPRETQEDLDVAVRILSAQTELTRSDVLGLLRRQNPKAKILATDSTVSIGQLTFRFARNGRLEQVDHPSIRRD